MEFTFTGCCGQATNCHWKATITKPPLLVADQQYIIDVQNFARQGLMILGYRHILEIHKIVGQATNKGELVGYIGKQLSQSRDCWSPANI